MELSQEARAVVDGTAWREFCRELAAAGELILRDAAPSDPLDRAEGFRLLTRLLRGGLESFLEHADPAWPVFHCPCHETIKIVAENPDNRYLSAAIAGQYAYRVWGTRGSSRYLSFQQYAAGAWGIASDTRQYTIDADDLEIGPDGRFELFLTPEERPGNWMHLDPDANQLAVRQTLMDPAAEVPAELHIERLGAQGAPPPLAPEKVARALRAVSRYVAQCTRMGAEWAERNAAWPNEFRDVQSHETRAFGDPKILYHQGYFEFGPGEAVLVEFTPPECDYWMFVLYNHWTESLDYRYHRIHLNKHSARYEPDGSVRIAVAHEDPGPGVANWLSTAGHRRGLMAVRWVDSRSDPLPRARVVKLAEVCR